MATENLQVGASTDDAHQHADTDNADLTIVDYLIGDAGGDGVWTAGFRFTNVGIPKDAVIDSAYLQLDATWAGDANVRLKVYAEDADDAVTFTTADGPTDRMANKTTAAIDWDPGVEWTADAFNDSPDIKSIIQEIVDRGSWASGNAIVILVADDGSNSWSYKEVYGYDNYAANAAKLVINYTTTVSYTMPAAVGSFVLTGIAAILNKGYTIVAALGTFTLTGIASLLVISRKITAAVGTFTLTGIANTLIIARKITASVGSFILTGISVTLTYSQAAAQTTRKFIRASRKAIRKYIRTPR